MDYTNDITQTSFSFADSYWPPPGDFTAPRAFDNSGSTLWSSAGTALPHWIGQDFGAGNTKTVVKYSITTRNDSAWDYAPKDFYFQGSNNGSDWDNVDTRTGITWSGPSEKQSFTFTNTVAYRYYRLYITALHNGSTYQTSFDEVEMMERLPGIDSYTKLMLHCNGADASTSFPDDSSSIHSMTTNGGAQIDTDFSKFSGASGLFDGVGDFVSTPNSSDFDFGSGDWTIDFWVRRNGSQVDYGCIIAGAQSGLTGWNFGFGAGATANKLRLVSNASGSWSENIVDTDVLTDTTWRHVALVRNGNTLSLYIDGVSKASQNVSGYNFNSAGTGLVIGRAYTNSDAYYYKGWIDELRISKGTARWTENFTPPTEEYLSLDNINITPSTLTATGVLQTPLINIPITVTPSLLTATGTLYAPEVGEILTLLPTLLNAIANLELPSILISSSVLPTVLTATGTIQTPSYPGLSAMKSATKIISYNPLVIITSQNPLKLAQIDITDPSNPISVVYSYAGVSGAIDVVYDSIFEKIYIACNAGKIIEIDSTDFGTYTIYDTGITTNLKQIELLQGYQTLFASTDRSLGEIVVMDDSVKTILSTDIRWVQNVAKFINCFINTTNALSMNFDLRWSGVSNNLLGMDIRFNQFASTVPLEPISRLDFHVFLDNIEVTDVKMDEIDIYHYESEKSKASIVLSRQHDNLNYTLAGVYSQITAQNTLRIEIDGHVEFNGFICSLDSRSQEETVKVTAYSTEPKIDERSLVTLSVPSINERLHLYHALVHNPTIENPYILEDDPNPSMYKGIFMDEGYDEKQNISRWSSFENSASVAESVTNGSFIPKQNWTYFWLASAENFISGEKWATLNYVGTSPASLTSDTWNITGMAYKYQRKFESTKVRLGEGIVYAEDFKYVYTDDAKAMYELLKPHGSLSYNAETLENYINQPSVYAIMDEKMGYRIGEAPYKNVNAKAGRLLVSDQWEDKPDGMYVHRDESYDYREYVKKIAELEYQKIQNINGNVLPKTNADIEIFIDSYYYHNISLLKRINIDNTITPGIYNNLNGFPVSVKSIEINSGTMKVNLRCNNQWSRTEMLEIEALYPSEGSSEYVFPETNVRMFPKFDTRLLENIE